MLREYHNDFVPILGVRPDKSGEAAYEMIGSEAAGGQWLPYIGNSYCLLRADGTDSGLYYDADEWTLYTRVTSDAVKARVATWGNAGKRGRRK